MAAPVVKLASPDASQATIAPISSGVPNLPSGMLAAFSAKAPSSVCPPLRLEENPVRVMSVCIVPGHIALTMILYGANSKASDCVRLMTQAFEAEYTPHPGQALLPACEAVLIIRPPLPLEIITRAAARLQASRPKTLTAKTASTTSSPVSRRSATWWATPALLTITSIEPCCSAISPDRSVPTLAVVGHIEQPGRYGLIRQNRINGLGGILR